MIIQFDSLAALGKAAETVEPWWGDETYLDWAGETYDATVQKCFTGDTALVSEAEKLLEKIEAQVETPSRLWAASIVGQFPSVPDFVAGHPECMRRLSDTVSEAAPVRVLVCTTSSAVVDKSVVRRRGVAVLAAVMALSAIRPVELHTFTALNGRGGFTNVTTRINSAPICMSEACYALTSVGVDRALTHSIAKGRNYYDGGWCDGGLNDANMRRITKANSEDLIVMSSHVSDALIISNPVAWVNQQIARYTTEEVA